MTGNTLQQRAEMLAETQFLGGPVDDFERMGLEVFSVLLREGLRPSSRVLDVGCGALRLGYWLMRFLDPGRYYGIEPNHVMLDAALDGLIGQDLVETAHARFDVNDRFDFSVFGEKFDFVVARSIWTHASKSQIETMLDSFAAAAAPRGVFLASYRAATALRRLGVWRPGMEQRFPKLALATLSPLLASLPSVVKGLGGDEEKWVGRSHQSDTPGVVRHSLRWISQAASERGLEAEPMPYPVFHRQF